MSPGEKLNEKQKLFCENFACCANATASYLVAYPGSSKEAARRTASFLLTNPDVASYIEQLKEEKEGEHILLTRRIKEKYLKASEEIVKDFKVAIEVYRSRMEGHDKWSNRELVLLATFKKMEFETFLQGVDAIARFEGLGEIEQRILADASNRNKNSQL